MSLKKINKNALVLNWLKNFFERSKISFDKLRTSAIGYRISMIISIMLGLLIGTLYGLFFVMQQGRALSLNQATFIRHLTQSISLSCIRFIILAMCVLYILHSSAIDLILILISFTTAFWYIVHNKRIHRREWY